jgi:heat-inducible transcriptional repressor
LQGLRANYANVNTPITELNHRTRTIFRVVVESYLESGAPVGSRTLSKVSGLNLSPASIRNVMQDLEEAGLLAAPHTDRERPQAFRRWYDAGSGTDRR